MTEPSRIRCRPAQRGDRVEVACGDHAGRTGQVVGIRLDEGRRCVVVLLDATGDAGVRLRRFAEGLLRVLD